MIGRRDEAWSSDVVGTGLVAGADRGREMDERQEGQVMGSAVQFDDQE